MSRSIEFRSCAFPPRAGEEHEVNPGRYGKALASFVAAELGSRGFPILRIAAEDWGWRVDVRNDDFPLWIGCGNVDGEENAFLCFVEPAQPTVGTWLRRRNTSATTDHLAAAIYDILSANADVEQLTWSD